MSSTKFRARAQCWPRRPLPWAYLLTTSPWAQRWCGTLVKAVIWWLCWPRTTSRLLIPPLSWRCVCWSRCMGCRLRYPRMLICAPRHTSMLRSLWITEPLHSCSSRYLRVTITLFRRQEKYTVVVFRFSTSQQPSKVSMPVKFNFYCSVLFE